MTTIMRTPARARVPRAAEADEEDALHEALDDGPIAGVADFALDLERLEGVLQNLIACRRLLDQALKEG